MVVYLDRVSDCIPALVLYISLASSCQSMSDKATPTGSIKYVVGRILHWREVRIVDTPIPFKDFLRCTAAVQGQCLKMPAHEGVEEQVDLIGSIEEHFIAGKKVGNDVWALAPKGRHRLLEEARTDEDIGRSISIEKFVRWSLRGGCTSSPRIVAQVQITVGYNRIRSRTCNSWRSDLKRRWLQAYRASILVNLIKM